MVWHCLPDSRVCPDLDIEQDKGSKGSSLGYDSWQTPKRRNKGKGKRNNRYDDCTENALTFQNCFDALAEDNDTYQESENFAPAICKSKYNEYDAPSNCTSDIGCNGLSAGSSQDNIDCTALPIIRVDENATTIEIFTYGAAEKDKHNKILSFHCDVRRFADPGAGRLKLHDGRHCDILGRIIGHPCFDDWIANMRERLT